MVVPDDYDHDTHLDAFVKKHEKDFGYLNPALTSRNFANATTRLAAGRRLKVKAFEIVKTVSSENCLAFLRTQNAILTGAHGASLFWKQNADALPKGKWYLSFDEKEALWKDARGYRRVPYVYRRLDGSFYFNLGTFEYEWNGDYGRVLLCFCDE